MSHKFIVGLGLCLLLLGAAGCSRSESSGTTAPFTATYANLRINVPARADLFQASNHDFGLMVTICRRVADVLPPLCEHLSSPLVNEHGVLTYLKQPKAGTKFNLIKEQPADGTAPAPIPLLPIADNGIDRNILAGGEAYELTRLNMGGSNQWFTTSNGWPIAGCARDPRGQHFCTVGFLVAGAFVEAHWFPERSIDLTQQDIWAVANAIDKKLTELADGTPRLQYQLTVEGCCSAP